MGAAVVEPAAIGRPEWEDFEFVRVVLDVHHFVAVHVINNQVALRVKHFNLVDVACVETLHRLVCAVGDELQPRMPRRIDAS